MPTNKSIVSIVKGKAKKERILDRMNNLKLSVGETCMYLTAINDEIMCTSKSGNKIYWMLTSEIGAENFELRYIEIPPRGRSSYGHHSHEHEVFVVEGEGIIKLKEGQEKLRPRLAVFVSGGEEHQWINTSHKRPLGFVCVVPREAEAELKPPCK